MKVLYVGSDALVCGASFSMVKLIEELDQLGVEVIPVVHHGNTERILNEKGRQHYVVDAYSWSLSLSYSKVKAFFIKLVKKSLNIPCFFKYVRIIREENPDIIHINALTTYTIALAALACHKPFVWHIREMMEEDLNSSFWNQKEAHKLMKKADRFIAISKCVEEKYKKIVGKQKIQCIYNGIDTACFLRTDHKILNNEKIVITMAGRITKSKGQFSCLQSLVGLLKANPQVILQFAGVGNDQEVQALHALCIEEGIAEQVKFLGFVKDMENIWAETDIAVVYSKFEAFGRVTIEAKMAGALVVGYNSGGTTELINDRQDGYLFGNGHPTLDEVVEKVLKEPRKAQLIAETGRNSASSVFTSENNAKQIQQLYQDILANQ